MAKVVDAKMADELRIVLIGLGRMGDMRLEEIAKRVKRASIETKEEEKEGEKTKEKEETNEEEYAYAEINSVLKRLHFEARERRRTSMSP